MKRNLILAIALTLTVSAFAGSKKSAKSDAITKIQNIEFSQVLKKARNYYKIVGDTTFGKDVTIYTTNSAVIQWPVKFGDSDLKVLQDSVAKSSFGVSSCNIDSAIVAFVSHPQGYNDFPLQRVDSIPFSDENNRIISDNVTVSIKDLTQKMLVYKFEYDTYSGGAHPSYAASFLNYDVKKNKILSYNDVFEANCDSTLLNVIKSQLCEKYYVDSVAELSTKGGIFTDAIFVTHNFYFTSDGITFFYNPYEIGPWAIGVVEVPVDFYLISKFVKPEIYDIFKYEN